jgi:restriction endonuclease Mrr
MAFLSIWESNTVMMDHDVGVTEESRYIIKKIDLDYFTEE